jgi:micrococcal nuclease
VKAAAIGGISAGIAAVILIGVFVGMGENKSDQPTEYERTLQESISSESAQTSESDEPIEYVRELEESVSSESTSNPDEEDAPTMTPIPPVPPQSSEPKENNCDPSYPDVCIPSYPPDLDCGQIEYKNFIVGSDPHGFDGDNDGIGCES